MQSLEQLTFNYDITIAVLRSPLSTGNTLDKDSSEFSSAIIFGVGNENTQVTGVMNYYHRNSIFNRDRGGLSSKPPFSEHELQSAKSAVEQRRGYRSGSPRGHSSPGVSPVRLPFLVTLPFSGTVLRRRRIMFIRVAALRCLTSTRFPVRCRSRSAGADTSARNTRSAAIS